MKFYVRFEVSTVIIVVALRLQIIKNKNNKNFVLSNNYIRSNMFFVLFSIFIFDGRNQFIDGGAYS